MTPCCSVWALLKGPAHPQAAMPPPNGTEGTDESYTYTYSPFSEESEEERCSKQTQRIGEKRQRAHTSEVSEGSEEEEASPNESASKTAKRRRLHNSVVAESSSSEVMKVRGRPQRLAN